MDSIQLLRHTLATVAYRGGKALRGAPPEFAAFKAAEGTRTPGEILAHIGDLFDWALSIANGKETWRHSPAVSWDEGTARFFAALRAFDDRLAAGHVDCGAEKLFQGPIADALTHIGQISMLRRLAGAPVKGENYSVAKIAAGSTGPEQPPAVREFD